jgi:hypothetical protein
MKRHLCILTLSALASFVAVRLCARWRWRAWREVPPGTWEQVAAWMRYGAQSPLDEVQILADVQEWLDGELNEGAGV